MAAPTSSAEVRNNLAKGEPSTHGAIHHVRICVDRSVRGRGRIVEERMGVVRLGPNGEVAIIERGAAEERERADAAVLEIRDC